MKFVDTCIIETLHQYIENVLQQIFQYFGLFFM